MACRTIMLTGVHDMTRHDMSELLWVEYVYLSRGRADLCLPRSTLRSSCEYIRQCCAVSS